MIAFGAITKGDVLAVARVAGLRLVHVSLDSLDPDVFTAMCGRKTSTPTFVLEASRRPPPPASPRSRSTASCQRGVNRPHDRRPRPPLPGTATSVRFIEFMDVGTSRLGPQPGRHGGRDRGADRRRRAPRAGRGQLRGRSGQAVALRRRVGPRSRHLLGQPAFCGDCTRARLSTEGPARHLPLRRRWASTSGARCADRGASDEELRT